eukprot:777929-Alexandrium_andersonii.AAC.1
MQGFLHRGNQSRNPNHNMKPCKGKLDERLIFKNRPPLVARTAQPSAHSHQGKNRKQHVSKCPDCSVVNHSSTP